MQIHVHTIKLLNNSNIDRMKILVFNNNSNMAVNEISQSEGLGKAEGT